MGAELLSGEEGDARSWLASSRLVHDGRPGQTLEQPQCSWLTVFELHLQLLPEVETNLALSTQEVTGGSLGLSK